MKQVGKMWVLDDDDFFTKHLDTAGHFEYNKVLAALKYVTNWDCFIDGGAHYGTWSIPLSQKFKKVISFEGSERIYECLSKNTENIHNIEINNVAIGDRFDNVKIGMGKERGSLGNSGLRTFVGSGNTPMIPIDSLNIKSLGLMKLDVEGYELPTLRGAEETLLRCKPVIIFEENRRCLEHNVNYGDSGKYLESLGAELAEKIHTDLIYKWK